VLDNYGWIYIDDLHEKILRYESLYQLYELQKGGWFFCVYIKESHISDQTNDVHFEITNTITNTSTNTSRKRKLVEDDLKDYPLRSKFIKHENNKPKVDKKYYAKNKELINVKRKNFYKNNKNNKRDYYEKTKEKRKEYLEKTKNSRKQKRKEYYEKNKEKIKAKQRERDDAKKNSENKNKYEDLLGVKFHKKLEMEIFQCKTCKEAWPLSKSPKVKSDYECVRCGNSTDE